jgi:hypothetical protein
MNGRDDWHRHRGRAYHEKRSLQRYVLGSASRTWSSQLVHLGLAGLLTEWHLHVDRHLYRRRRYRSAGGHVRGRWSSEDRRCRRHPGQLRLRRGLSAGRWYDWVAYTIALFFEILVVIAGLQYWSRRRRQRRAAQHSGLKAGQAPNPVGAHQVAVPAMDEQTNQ